MFHSTCQPLGHVDGSAWGVPARRGEDDERGRRAAHIPLGAISGAGGEIPQDRQVYAICRSGARSAYVAQALAGEMPGGRHGQRGRWHDRLGVAGRPMISETGAEPYVA